VVSTPALVLCCGWLGRFGAAAARLEMPVARKGKAMVRVNLISSLIIPLISVI
jgi:hypothetical protein